MQELHGHLQAQDWKAAADCFKSACNMVDAEPHEEGEHEPHSYEAQKED